MLVTVSSIVTYFPFTLEVSIVIIAPADPSAGSCRKQKGNCELIIEEEKKKAVQLHKKCRVVLAGNARPQTYGGSGLGARSRGNEMSLCSDSALRRENNMLAQGDAK